MPDSVAHRRELAKKGQMGCPGTLNYPLDTKAHVKSAVSYYGHEDTVKCQGFWSRTCRAAKRVGLDTPKIQEKCK
jgi:hypothetical protein